LSVNPKAGQQVDHARCGDVGLSIFFVLSKVREKPVFLLPISKYRRAETGDA
jgi:hypothetical protein